MKKKIISGALLLAMLVSSLLVSCTDGENTETKSPASDSSVITGTQETDENGDDVTNGETDAVTEEPEPELPYPTENDNFAGTPAYTVDGDKIIVDGVAYPNKNNFNCKFN